MHLPADALIAVIIVRETVPTDVPEPVLEAVAFFVLAIAQTHVLLPALGLIQGAEEMVVEPVLIAAEGVKTLVQADAKDPVPEAAVHHVTEVAKAAV